MKIVIDSSPLYLPRLLLFIKKHTTKHWFLLLDVKKLKSKILFVLYLLVFLVLLYIRLYRY